MLGARLRCSLLIGSLACLPLLATGCGGSKSPAIANLGTTSSSTTNSGSGATGSRPTEAQMEQDALKYSECMRSSGVPNYPDPKASGGFVLQAGSGIDPSSPTFQAAEKKCSKLLPGGGPPAPGTETHPSAQALAQMVKAARCMRAHGVPDFPDPATKVTPLPRGSGGGVISDIDGVILEFPDSIDMQSSAFVRAAAVCKFPLHNH
jgi:hypothetical protein